MIEQNQPTHETGEILRVHAAATLQRARLNEVFVWINARGLDIGIAPQVILGIEYLQALQSRNSSGEGPPVDLTNHPLIGLDLRLFTRCLRRDRWWFGLIGCALRCRTGGQGCFRYGSAA